ncbi:hypothetical protein EDB92DRAFT_761910 [Lactarius akahatsu]|uniref:Uncharacterized protein n=1 Tax=Lactarius akahatsu TaxID=416441 RepID=A0AAD4QDB9_9AGAM|nr:hypothetical protein EDB92DRAFT_761910 [Lactarius akahatsu]
MSSLPNHTIVRHSTPPLSPTTSLNSSATSSAPSSCTSSQRGSLNHLSAARPITQHFGHHDPTEKLGLMIDRLEEDVVMLDDWEEDEDEDEKQTSGAHGSSQSSDHSKPQASPGTPQQPVSIPFSLESTPSPRSIAHSTPQQPSQLPQRFKSQPSTDVVDVAKLARQDQPPPAYENLDEHLPSDASHSSSLNSCIPPFTHATYRSS